MEGPIQRGPPGTREALRALPISCTHPRDGALRGPGQHMPKYTTGDETSKYRENHAGAQAQCHGAVANGDAGRHCRGSSRAAPQETAPLHRLPVLLNEVTMYGR